MSPDLPAAPDLDHLRKQAKRLLRAARAGNPAALTRLRALPHLAKLPDQALAVAIRLADAQLAIAREHGAESWPKLKRAVEEAAPLAARAARFLAAIRDGDAARARRLLARQPALARESFHAACAAGDAEFVAHALDREARLASERDPGSDWTPLIYACASPLHAEDGAAGRFRACAEALLAHGADPNEFTIFEDGETKAPIAALYYACVSGNAAVVRLLLEKGANPNDGESVYHAAELDRRECLELLMAHGADLSGAQAPYGNTPLYFLMGYPESHAGAAAVSGGTTWLLEHGADPNVTSGSSAETPLHRVAAGGRSHALAGLLLDHGADASARRGDGRTPYVLALRAGNVALTSLLAERDADTGGATPADELLGACMRADEAAARALLASHPGLIETLNDEDRGVLVQAVHDGREPSLKLMAALGMDLASEGAWGGTPLHHAAWTGNAHMVRALLALGVPVNARDRRFGSSPLAWAAHGSRHCRRADDEYREVIEALLAAGADRESSINRWNEPPESLSSPAVARLLEERGFAPRASGTEA